MAYVAPSGNAVDFTLSDAAYSIPLGFDVEFVTPDDAPAVQPPLLISGAALFAPAVAPGAVALAPPAIPSGSGVFSPGAHASNTLSAPLLPGAGAALVPAVSAASSLAAPLVAGAGAPLAPGVSVAAIPVSPPLLHGAGAAFAPQVLTDVIPVSPPMVAAGGSPFAPAASARNDVGAPLVAGGAAAQPPSVLLVGVKLSPPLIAPAGWCGARAIYRGGKWAGRFTEHSVGSIGQDRYITSRLAAVDCVQEKPATTVQTASESVFVRTSTAGAFVRARDV